MRTVKNLFNIDSYKTLPKLLQSSSGFKTFKDGLASRGLILERTLEQIDPTLFERKYPENTFINTGVEIDNTGGFAERITSLRIDDEGGFSDAKNLGDNKGNISVFGDTSSINVVERSARSSWSYSQIQQAAMQNYSLVNMIISAHNKIYLREVDAIFYVGIKEHGIKGLLNRTDVETETATKKFNALAGEELYKFIAKLINTQWTNVANTPEYMANQVHMPISLMNQMRSDFLNSNGTTMTVETALRTNFPAVNFGYTRHATDEIAVFSSSPDVMKGRIPVPLEIGEIIKLSSFKDELESMYRIAGLDVLETKGILIGKNKAGS